MKFLICGGTGFIGRALVNSLSSRKDDNFFVLTRSNKKSDRSNIIYCNEVASNQKFDVIINLAGASILRPWTKKAKQEIISSRIDFTLNLLSKIKVPPKLYIGMSATGIYSFCKNIESENDELGSHFLAEVCKKWEESHQKINAQRVIILRTSAVLNNQGGFLKAINIFSKLKLIIGFRKDSTIINWITLEDLIFFITHAIDNILVNGTFNLVANNPIAMNDLIKLSAKKNKLFVIMLPAFFKKIIPKEMRAFLFSTNKIFSKKMQEYKIGIRYRDLADYL